MRMLRCMAQATALAVLLLAMHATRCEGAAPSISVVNLPSALAAPWPVMVMAADGEGNIFLTGATAQFPVTAGAAQVQPGGGTCLNYSFFFTFSEPCTDAFVAKVQAASGALVYATYLGGDTDDAGTGIAVDTAGNVYVTGYTGGDFPTTPKAFIPTATSGLFVAKLNSDGSRFLYSTYLPGTSPQPAGPLSAPPAIVVDSEGNAYITGQTAEAHAFVVKISPDGSELLYNTVLQGSNADAGAAIAVDASGNAYVAGLTTSPDFPVSAGAFQAHLAGPANAFVARLDASGRVVFATYLGGSGYDQSVAVQADSAGNVYVAGTSTSLDFPTTAGSFMPKALMPASAHVPGGFAAKLSPAGALVYSTYIVGAEWEGSAVANMILDSSGGSYLSGESGPGLPVTASAPQPCLGGDEDVVVTHLGPSGNLLDRTYFGGPYFDAPIGLAFSGDHSVWLAALIGGEPNPTPVLAQLNFGDSQTPAASCLSPDVLNGATFFAGTGIAPGAVISLTGFGIGPQKGLSYQLGPDGGAPLQLGDVQVDFDGQPVPLLYVQSQQVNAFAPFELAGRATTNVQVKYKGAVIGSVNAPVATGNAGLFRLNPFSTQAVAINQDGTVNGPANPAPAGSVISLFGTGYGQTQLPGVTGSLSPDDPSPLVTPVQVGIGSAFADVLYAGAAPLEFAGVVQFNVRVPAGAGTGDAVPVYVQNPSTLPGVEITTISVR